MALAPLTLPLIQRIEALAKKSHLTVVAFFLESALFAFSHILTADQALFLLNADKSPETSQRALKILGYFTPTQFIASLLRLTRNPSAGVNVAAIAALTKLQYYATDPAQKRSLSQPLLPALIPYILDQGNATLSTNTSSDIGLIPSSSPPNTRVFRTFAILCRDDKAISILALEAGVIKRLADIIKTADTVNWTNSELISECLLGLAAMSLHDHIFRQQVILTGVLIPMLQFMLAKPENPISAAAFGLRKIKIASCHLIRALARSISLLRTSLTTIDIVDGIYGLLKADPHEVVRAYERLYGPDFEDKEQALNDELGIKSAVMAAVCNLIPEFSALREPMVERGFLELILEGAHNSYPPLRLNSLWALKHVIYALPLERKAEVMNGLSAEYIMDLCRDKEPQIQEQALCFLRNFIYSKNLDMLVTLFDSIGIENFLNMIEDKIVENTDPEYLDQTPGSVNTSAQDEEDDNDNDDKTNQAIYEVALETNPFDLPPPSNPGSLPPLPRQSPELFRWGSSTSQAAMLATKLDQRSLILIAAEYVLVHLAAISDTYKDTILGHPRLMNRLLPLLRHRAAEVKVACCWILINLTYCEEYVAVPIQIPPGASAETVAAVTAPSTEENLAAAAQREAALQHERSVRQRVKQLAKLGFQDRIKTTMNDGTLDVAQRAKYALSLMEKYSE